MSFRLRVLLLVVSIAVTATAATAWLTLTQATREINKTVTADQRQVDSFAAQLGEYGLRRGGWDGVDAIAARLASNSGQRLQLVTEAGQVLFDSDVAAGRVPRPVPGAPVLVDPRPELRLPAGMAAKAALGAAVDAVGVHRLNVRLAQCLSAAGAETRLGEGRYGVPRVDPVDLSGRAAAVCGARVKRGLRAEEFEVDEGLLAPCDGILPGPVVDCLRRAFRDRIGSFAPVPLRLYVGARETYPASLAIWPTAAAAGAVVLLAVAGTLLLSRRVLRPIGALTAASRRLGGGDLAERVPVAGRDELAELGREFNRMADSLQRSEQRQRQMVADVAHELRTPLANLRGYLEALKDGVIPPGPEVFASLHEDALLQQRIVNDLQELALAEAGALAYHRTWVDVAELAESCRAGHLPQAAAAGVTLAAGPAAAVLAYADPDRLRQALGNLISNAVRATAAGGRVEVAVRATDATVAIEVRDTGVGIAAADLPHVFDRFWRADAARGRGTGGSGLGLAITRQIMTDHGGGVAVASTPGVGSVFTLTLPRVTECADPAAAPPKGQPFTPPGGERGALLRGSAQKGSPFGERAVDPRHE